MDPNHYVETVFDYFTRPGAIRATVPTSGACRYRTPTGHCCAIGCAIPKAMYHEILEGQGWEEIARIASDDVNEEEEEWDRTPFDQVYDLFMGDLSDVDGNRFFEFLDGAQRAHDEAGSVPEFLHSFALRVLTYEYVIPARHERWLEAGVDK